MMQDSFRNTHDELLLPPFSHPSRLLLAEAGDVRFAAIIALFAEKLAYFVA
jgi:hypothetical protein